MSARRYAAGLAAAAVAVSAFAAAPSASADPSFIPQSADLVGGGSDTSQFVLTYLADGLTVNGVEYAGYNANKPAEGGRLVSFDAKTPTNSAQVTLVQGATPITRPNGSGGGKGLLHGGGNNPDLDYARSSSALNAAEISAGLQAFPFAVDVLEMATANTSNAPANISTADLVKIYKGDVTNWSEITGGKSGVIKPLIPQSGSGTRSFFEGELKALNGGVDVALASSVQEVQEHDAAPIMDDPNAIAPFSAGRARIEGTINLVGGGLSAKRALYNVVRGSDVDDAEILGIFGSEGFICSDDARPLIEAAGFDQMARPEDDGVCGEPTQDKSSNFNTNVAQATATTLTATSPTGGQVVLSAKVSVGNATADGKVQFFEGDELVGEASIAQGTATRTLTGVAPGNHTYSARFVPASGAYEVSVSEAVSVAVKANAQVTASIAPASTTYGKAATVAVTVSGATGAPTGQVTATVAGRRISGTLAGGKASISLPANLAVGQQRVAVAYAGDASYGAASATASLAVAKAASKMTVKLKKKVKKGKRATATVKVALPGTSLKAAGKVTIKNGKKVVGKGKVKNGTVKVKLKKFKKGSHKLSVAYNGNKNISGATKSAKVKQK